MKYYQEVSVIHGTGIDSNSILSDVCFAIHNALTEKPKQDVINIGISFPSYVYNSRNDKGTLGDTMRVFALTKVDLEKLNIYGLIGHIEDYLSVSNIEEVGDKVTHYEIYTRSLRTGLYKRAVKLYNHFLKKHGKDVLIEKFGDFDGVLQHCKDNGKEYRNYPFIQTKSNSNQNDYLIRLDRTVVDKASSDFKFNSYGINQGKSQQNTVPAW